MNIAFYFTSEINPIKGGTERVTHVLANALCSFGFNCIFISFKSKSASENYNNRQFYLPNNNNLICKENIEYVRNLIKHKNIDVLINQDSFDEGNEFCSNIYFPNVKCITVIHYNLFGSCIYVKDILKENYILGNSNVLKYIFQILLTPFYKWRALKDRKEMLRRIYQNSSYVVVLSESDKIIYPVKDKSRIYVITNPVSLDYSERLVQKDKKVLYVGRMVFSPKRVDFLLRVWKLLESKHPDWSLDILGSGNCLEYYKSLKGKLHLNNVTFYGNQVPNVFYERASIFCMTSTYEGFGLTLTEAMNAGAVPVAFESYAAVNDIIKNGIDGFLIKPFDIKKFAYTIELLMENDELRSKMSKAAKLKMKNFNINKIVQDWISLFNTI